MTLALALSASKLASVAYRTLWPCVGSLWPSRWSVETLPSATHEPNMSSVRGDEPDPFPLGYEGRRISRSRQESIDMMARAATMLEADPASPEGLRALQDVALKQRSFAFAIQIEQRLSDLAVRSSNQLPIARAHLHL